MNEKLNKKKYIVWASSQKRVTNMIFSDRVFVQKKKNIFRLFIFKKKNLKLDIKFKDFVFTQQNYCHVSRYKQRFYFCTPLVC